MESQKPDFSPYFESLSKQKLEKDPLMRKIADEVCENESAA